MSLAQQKTRKVESVIAVILVSIVFIICFSFFLNSSHTATYSYARFEYLRAVETTNELIPLGGVDGGEGKAPYEADQVEDENNDDNIQYSHAGPSESSQQDTLRNSSTQLESKQPQSFNWRNLPKKLYQLAPFIFDTVPKQFIPEFKNPCWYEPHKQLKCLPYFYILGFPKCGTTDLWNKINNHPNVAKTRRKETQFWRGHKSGDSSGFYDYLSNAMSISDRLLSGDTGAVYGDGSATTIITPWKFVKYFPNVTSMYTNVDIIKELTPKAKMIIAIREPVARLYSGYVYHYPGRKNETRSTSDFHQISLKTKSDFYKCLAQEEKLKCVFEQRRSVGGSRYMQLQTGIYAPYIKAWVDGFGFDQVMVIRLEDWRANCTSILPKIFYFLELDVLDAKAISGLCIGKAQNVNRKGYTSIGDMLPSTKKLLEEFYAPYNEELAKYLNIPVYNEKL